MTFTFCQNSDEMSKGRAWVNAKPISAQACRFHYRRGRQDHLGQTRPRWSSRRIDRPISPRFTTDPMVRGRSPGPDWGIRPATAAYPGLASIEAWLSSGLTAVKVGRPASPQGRGGAGADPAPLRQGGVRTRAGPGADGAGGRSRAGPRAPSRLRAHGAGLRPRGGAQPEILVNFTAGLRRLLAGITQP